MRIKKADYILTAVNPTQYPEANRKEIAFVGRSNVGKSSLINLLTNNKKLAKTSGKPGKTRTINFFLINEDFYFVDLPGYGYASAPKAVQATWGQMMEEYLQKRETLVGVVLLLDIRHLPSKDDKLMMDYLKFYQIPTILTCTKSDKISRGKRPHYMKKIKEALDAKDYPIIPCSTLEKNGIGPLLSEIETLL